MAYASQMQFEVLRRALWAQQAQPQTIFDWKFWEKAAQDPKMTAYLNHGAKMCVTTPFVNSVGSQYIATQAQFEQACDSIRSQRPALHTCIVLTDGTVHLANASDHYIAKSLLKDVTTAWSTLTMRTTPFPEDLFQRIHPNHQVLLSCKPHRPGCHQWRPAHTKLAHQIRELQPDVIVECYLDARHYHCDPVELFELAEFNDTVENLLEKANIITIENAAIEEFNVATSLNDNFKERDCVPRMVSGNTSGPPKMD